MKNLTYSIWWEYLGPPEIGGASEQGEDGERVN